MEQTYLSRQRNIVTFFQHGLWLRQETEGGYFILNAAGIDLPDWHLKDVMVLFMAGDNSFLQRVDAERATLSHGKWRFIDVTLNVPGRQAREMKRLDLPTPLTRKDIEESFSSPETMAFWELPEFIRILETTGFDATRLRIHYQNLLAQPLLFAAMILLAATVSLRPPRLRGTLRLVSFGVFFGFAVFFLSSYLQALGASGQIPVFMAAWSAPLITFLMGLGVMLNLEDG